MAKPNTTSATTSPQHRIIDGIEYRPIPGYDGYFVGEDGSIGCEHYGHWKLRPEYTISKYGHRMCFIKPSGMIRGRMISCHRLVLLAWKGACPAGMECCHEDGDPTNNRPDNLRWDTRKNNHADKRKHGRWQCGETHPTARLTNEQILEIIEAARSGEPQWKIAERYDIDQPHVSNIVIGVAWSHLTGIKYTRRKLVNADALEIIERRARGELYKTIAVDYGCSPGNIQAICTGRSFSHVTGITRK